MPIHESITPQHTVDVLNRMLASDPAATKRMFIDMRTWCNKALAIDVHIQCGITDEQFDVGPLGIINGLFGSDDETGWGTIQANIDVICIKCGPVSKESGLVVGDLCPTCGKEHGDVLVDGDILSFSIVDQEAVKAMKGKDDE